MKISPEILAVEAEATGFRPDVLEKVAQLLGLLDALRSHPFLKGKLVLKGGTASFYGYKWTVAVQQLHKTAKARIRDATSLLTKEF
jgi:hypothetical protein